VRLTDPVDGVGRIKGVPLIFQVLVPREGIKVTGPAGAEDLTINLKAVLDAIFVSGVSMDKMKRLIVASETVRPPAFKDPP